MTPELLAWALGLKALREKATDGPWDADDSICRLRADSDCAVASVNAIMPLVDGVLRRIAMVQDHDEARAQGYTTGPSAVIESHRADLAQTARDLGMEQGNA